MIILKREEMRMETKKELCYELSGYLMSISENPKVERHIAKYLKYYVLGVLAFIYIMLIIAYNVIKSLDSPAIELPRWYYIFSDVVLNLFLVGFCLYFFIAHGYPVNKEACEKEIIKRVQPRIQWDEPCVILFDNDFFTVVSEEYGREGERIAYKDSEWIKAQDYIICISHNVIIDHVSEEAVNILRSRIF